MGELPDKTDSEWSKVARAVAILSGANLCETSPTRIRISDYGDRLLAESSQSVSTVTKVGDLLPPA